MRRTVALLAMVFSCLLGRAALAVEDPAPVESAEGGGDQTWSTSSCDCQNEPLECCDCGNCGQRLLGMLPSDHCFDSFISPLSNPFFFEDPRSLTEVRAIFIDNKLPSSIGGENINVWAAQVRGRISDRWSVIAPRLADIQLHPGGNGSPSGFLSAPVGFKYNWIRDVDRQFLVSVGATYFIPGATSAYANFSQGDFHFYLTGGKQILDRGHWLSGSGFRIPSNSNFGTQLWYWSNQWDYEVVDHWYGLFGVNWYHWMKNAANNYTNGIGGLDLINLPTNGLAGTNVVTAVVGGKWKPSPWMEIGTGFEFPLTNRTDILHNRVYADVIFRY